jgi:acyl-CoA dehydrogenase
MRALVYTAAGWFDHAGHNADDAIADRCRRHIDLLMPVLKAWNTETGNIVCDDAIQVFGGMGFIEETGVAQHYRDSRVTRIYEGTTGIQAIDLVGRKILRDNGATLRELLTDIRAEATALALVPELAGHAGNLSVNVGDLARAGEFLLTNGNDRLDVVHTAALPFLHLCGLVCAGWRVAQATRAAHAALADAPDNADYLRGVLAIGDFWFATYAPQVRAYAETVVASAGLATLPESAFLA